MEAQITEFLRLIDYGFYVGLIGGIFGAISGGWALIDRYKNRRAKLKVFAPKNWTGINSANGEEYRFVFLRFSNLSQSSTFLYFETCKIELYNENEKKWEQVKNEDIPKKDFDTDFTDQMKEFFGLNQPEFLKNIYADCSISFGDPLCGYITFKWPYIMTKMKIKIYDCNFIEHEFEIDFKKQIENYDPDYEKS